MSTYTVKLSSDHVMNICRQIAKKNEKWKPEGENKKLIDPEQIYNDAILNKLIIGMEESPSGYSIVLVEPGFIDRLWHGYCMDKYTAQLNMKAEKIKNIKSKLKKHGS